MGRVHEISPARKARLIALLKLEVQRQQITMAALSRSYHLADGCIAAIIRGVQAVPQRLAEAILAQMGITDIDTALGQEGEEPALPHNVPQQTIWTLDEIASMVGEICAETHTKLETLHRELRTIQAQLARAEVWQQRMEPFLTEESRTRDQ